MSKNNHRSFTCTFSSLGSYLTYTFYINLSTGYYEIESLSGVVKDSGHTLGEPSWESSQGIIGEFEFSQDQDDDYQSTDNSQTYHALSDMEWYYEDWLDGNLEPHKIALLKIYEKLQKKQTKEGK